MIYFEPAPSPLGRFQGNSGVAPVLMLICRHFWDVLKNEKRVSSPRTLNRAGARAMNPSTPVLPIRFGVFEICTRTGELRKQGLKVKLGPQAFKLLLLLLERHGEIRTREELRQQLWPSDTFVDFEHSLNKAMHVLR